MAKSQQIGNGQASEKAKAVLASLGMPTARINKCKNKKELVGEYRAWCAELPRREEE